MLVGIGLIRFYLASVVMFMHFLHFTDWKLLERMAAGIYGVSLFFLLSGFLVTNMIVKNRYDLRPQSFVLNRMLRIYPTYFFVLACALAFLPEAQLHIRNQAALHDWSLVWAYPMLFSRNTNVYFIGDWNPVLWTVDVELRAYLLITVLLFGARSTLGSRIREWVKKNGLPALFLLCGALAITIDIITVLMSPRSIRALVYYIENGDIFRFLSTLSAPVVLAGGITYFLPMFFIGAILALRPVQLPRLSGAVMTITLCAAVALFWNYLRIQTQVPEAWQAFDTMIFTATLGCIVCFLRNGPLNRSAWLKPIDSLLGNLSYPLYLLNFPVALWVATGEKLNLSGIFVTLILTLSLATACLSIIDEPIRRLRVRITEART